MPGENAARPEVNLIVIRSKDMQIAKRIYEEIGLVFTLHQHGENGTQHLSSTMGGVTFEIYPSRNPEKMEPEQMDPAQMARVRLGFSVDNLESVMASLRQLGVQIESEAAYAEWGLRATILDHDGNAVELVQREDQVILQRCSTGERPS